MCSSVDSRHQNERINTLEKMDSALWVGSVFILPNQGASMASTSIWFIQNYELTE